MKPKQQIFLLLLLPALFLLAACGGGAEPVATEPPPTAAEEEAAEAPAQEPEAPAQVEAEPTDTSIPPTETPLPPSPEPTDTAEPPTPEPTETAVPPTPEVSADFVDYENPEQGVSFRYPVDWILDDSFFITLASNESLVDGPDAGEEGAVVLVFTGSPDELGSENPADMMDEFSAEAFAEEEGVEIIEGPTELTINGQDAATMVMRGPAEEDEDRSIIVIITTISTEERVAVVLATTPEETVDEFRPLIDAVAQSVELSAPVQTEPEEEG